MAVGFTPKYQTDFAVPDLSTEKFIAIAVEAINKVGWQRSYLSESGLIAYTNKGIFAQNAEITIKLADTIVSVCSASTGSEMIDFGMNRRNVEAFLQAFHEIKEQISDEDSTRVFTGLKEELANIEDDPLLQPTPTKTEQLKGFLSIFVPRKDFFITPILIDINILIFVLMVASGINFLLPEGESLIRWGANFGPLTMSGQGWRLLTCCFIHIGILHLLMNMYALLYIGILLEPRLGEARFLGAYILTGIAASATSLWWHNLTISAGASGAIFGMYGVFLAMLTTNLIEKTARKALLTSIAVFVGYNLLYGMKSGIDNAAHIGGLLSGFVIGYAYLPSLRKTHETKLKYGTLGLISFLVILFAYFMYTNTSNDIGKYESGMKRFASMEAMALEVYQLPQDAPDEQILEGLNDRGIYYWNENIKLIEDLDKHNLPKELHERNAKVKRYCQLRKECYELIAKGITENTDRYEANIESYNKSIEAILKEFNQ